MGCCISKNTRDSDLTRWRSTGVVAFRELNLKVFPTVIFDVDTSIRTLDFTKNKLAVIPLEISRLINLQRLVLEDNLIKHLPESLGALKLLKVLILDRNQLTSLPDELGSLSKLERLSISGNVLTNLPSTFGNLRNLSLLNVRNNKLGSLPETIGDCTSLEELHGDGNDIHDLPLSICNLIYLKSLTLESNRLEKLPPNILKECKALQNVNLHNNPISMELFQQMDGFQQFEARRKKKFDKQIDSNVIISSRGLDEGVDL